MSSLPGAPVPPRALLPGEKGREEESRMIEHESVFREINNQLDNFFAPIATINSVVQ